MKSKDDDHRQFSLNEAKEIYSAGCDAYSLAPTMRYDAIVGTPIGYDKDENAYYAKWDAWSVEMEDLQDYLVKMNALKEKIFYHDSAKESLSTTLNKLKQVISNWELGKYPKLQQAPKSVYSQGEAFEYWKDLIKSLQVAKNEILIADPYTDTTVIDEFLKFCPAGVIVKVLTTRRTKECEMFLVGAKKKGIDCKTNDRLHDRMIFIDGLCILSGASLKDAAERKPTYLIQIESAEIVRCLRAVIEHMWIEGVG